ncbi:hypothetical protein [Cyanobium sp. ATX-6F1]|uniref:hypothetical protein n=1 Tax=Cyanobium sp. ATX-6F1 TaxID=3137388 RepID=UPI0039BE25F3
MAARLAIGAIHVRPEVMEWIGQETLDRLLMRHRRGDWGLVDGRDARANTLAAYHQQGACAVCTTWAARFRCGSSPAIWVSTACTPRC